MYLSSQLSKIACKFSVEDEQKEIFERRQNGENLQVVPLLAELFNHHIWSIKQEVQLRG